MPDKVSTKRSEEEILREFGIYVTRDEIQIIQYQKELSWYGIVEKKIARGTRKRNIRNIYAKLRGISWTGLS